jgi:hypothetical protein
MPTETLARLSGFSPRTGVSIMPAKTEPSGPTMTAAEKHAVSRGHNTVPELERRFFDPRQEGFVGLSVASTGERVAVRVPTAQYSQPSLLVAAAQREMKAGSDGIVPSFYEYDLTPEAQTLYWHHVLESLRAIDEYAQDKPGHGLVAINTMATLSTPEISTSKSMAAPHAHIIYYNPDFIEDGTWEIDHLTHEQKQKQRREPQIAGRRLTSRLKQEGEASGAFVDVAQLRLGACGPHGYEFNIAPKDGRIILPEDLQKIMVTNHGLYGNLAERYFARHIEDQTLVPQPSYRLYMVRYDTPGGENLHVMVSPEVWSGAGALEDLGILLTRKMGAPDKIPSSEQEAFNAVAWEQIAESREALEQRMTA